MPHRPIQFVKTALVIGSLLLLAGSVYAGRSPRIQGESFAFEVEPMPLPKAAKELAKLFGAPVKVSETLAPSTLAIWSPRTTVAEIRAKVAGAFNATWSLRGGVWYLEQTVQQMRAEDAAELEAKRIVIRTMLERYREQSKSEKPFDDGYAGRLKGEAQLVVNAFFERSDENVLNNLNALQAKGPGGRLIQRLVGRLTENHFLQVPFGERRVFALKPTPTQLKLGFDPTNDLKQFVAEQAAWSRATDGKPIQPTNMSSAYVSGIASDVQPLTQPIENVYISIRHHPGASFEVRCMVPDPKGIFLAEGDGRSYSLDENQNQESDLLFGLGEKAKADHARLSAESVLFRNLLFGKDLVTNQLPTIPRDFLIRAAKLTAKDPLAYSTWEFLKAEARERNVSLVANLPDHTARLSYGLLKFLDNTDPSKKAKSYFGTLQRTEPGWVILYPKSVKLERSRYRDRVNLEKQIALRRQGGASIEVQAAYAATLPETDEFSVLDDLVTSFAPHKLPIYNYRFFLRLYGSTPKSIIEAMENPNGILFSDLPRKVQDQIRKHVYSSGSHVFNFVSKTGENFTPTWALFEHGVLKEPTVSMPNGIPNRTSIRTVTTSKEMLLTAPTTQRWGPIQGELLTPEELARALFERAHSDVFGAINKQSEIPTKGIKLFRQRQIKIMIDFKNEVQVVGTLTDGEPVGSGTYSLETLPAGFKKRFQTKLKALEDSWRKDPPLTTPKKDIPPGPLPSH